MLNIRLACSECDCDQYDGIDSTTLTLLESEGWQDITEVQSYEDSIKTYRYNEETPANYSVLDWYTHIGLCPTCQLSREDTL